MRSNLESAVNSSRQKQCDVPAQYDSTSNLVVTRHEWEGRPGAPMCRQEINMIEEPPCRSQERTEARATKRYPIVVQASFQWRGADRTWYQGIGITQDIGASGVFILAHEVPPLGAEIEVTMVIFPAERKGATSKGRLTGKGTVVRVTAAAGFAAAVIFHVLRAA